MDILEKIFNLAGSLICHQLPSRSLYAGEAVLPVCARDTGIYIGVFTSAFFIICFHRLKSQKLPGTVVSLCMCILMLPMVADGMLSYTGIIETNNLTRLLTGVFFGIPIPFFLVPAAHFSIYGINTRAVLKNKLEPVFVYCIALVLCYLVWNGKLPYAAVGFIFISGLLFLLSRLTYTVYCRLGHSRGTMLYGLTGLTTLGVLTFLYLVSAFLLQPLKNLLLGA